MVAGCNPASKPLSWLSVHRPFVTGGDHVTPSPLDRIENRRALRAWLAAILLLASGGCTTEILYIDPPVTWKATGNDCLGDGGQEAVLGMYHEQMFTAFTDEPEAAIRTGFQGGVWCMPAMRVVGTEPAVRVIGEIVLEDNTVVARSVYAHYELKLAPDGKCEEQQLPIQIVDKFAKQNALPSLYGEKAMLKIVLQNKKDKKTVEAKAPVVLVEG